MPASGTAAYGALETPLQYQSQIINATNPSLLVKIDDFIVLKNKIESLETTIETKDTRISFLKEQKQEELDQQVQLYVSIDQALLELSSYVGKTPYVFSGSTPRGWDCSGLTSWFYQTYRGIDLPHSATAQKNQGTIVDAPIPGDIVAFTYKNQKNAYHVGIYIGAGMMIHSINPKRDTVLESIDSFSRNDTSTVAYIRY
jgi:cell wall-associated NlpC family hydrolase